MGPSPTINVRRHRHGRMPAHRRLCWNRTTTQPHSQPNAHCIRESYPNRTTHLSAPHLCAHHLCSPQPNLSQVCIYIFFFACSWGPCAWVVTGEIFPLKARARGLSMTTAANWLLNWAIAYATPYIVRYPPFKDHHSYITNTLK